MKSSSSFWRLANSCAISTWGCFGPGLLYLDFLLGDCIGDRSSELLVIVMLLVTLSWLGLGSWSDLSEDKHIQQTHKSRSATIFISTPIELQRWGRVIRSHQNPTRYILILAGLNVQLFLIYYTVGASGILIVDSRSTMPTDSTRSFVQVRCYYWLLLGRWHSAPFFYLLCAVASLLALSVSRFISSILPRTS